MPELLLELLSEEIPARMQARGAESLKALFCEAIEARGLEYGEAKAFVTPRRLVLVVSDVSAFSRVEREERKGPRLGAPEQAIEGFLRSTGLAREALVEKQTEKGAFYFGIFEVPARGASEIIGEVLEKILSTFPWPKSMRWGRGRFRWVRPLHRILCILSDEGTAETVPLSVGGIEAGDKTQGHFAHSEGAFRVKSFEDYADKLLKNKVILDAHQRREKIAEMTRTLAFANGLEVVEDAALLDEVSGLVEWPIALSGVIEQEFMELPVSVLRTSMRTHQKFFSLINPKSGFIERFVTIANIETSDAGEAILSGYQKVLYARLRDAKFFWENDVQKVMTGAAEMGDWQGALEKMTFHHGLGTQAGRVERIETLAGEVAVRLGGEPLRAAQAARLAKADLCSEMVQEFPELQGVMGQIYAQKSGIDKDIAEAIRAHYAPLGPSEPAPKSLLSIAVALCDKCDLLAGFWAIDEKPTGSKDPFALRRSALGIIRIILENQLKIDLKALLEKAFSLHDVKGDRDEMLDDLVRFIHDRLEIYLRGQGLSHDVIRAVAKVFPFDLVRLRACAQALARVLEGGMGAQLVQTYRRAANILAQAEAKDGVSYSYGGDAKLAETDEERAVFATLGDAQGALEAALGAGDFVRALELLGGLCAPIDAFFEAVKINVANEIVRRNRLNLLHDIRSVMERVSDFDQIAL